MDFFYVIRRPDITRRCNHDGFNGFGGFGGYGALGHDELIPPFPTS